MVHGGGHMDFDEAVASAVRTTMLLAETMTIVRRLAALDASDWTTNGNSEHGDAEACTLCNGPITDTWNYFGCDPLTSADHAPDCPFAAAVRWARAHPE